jgi:hypothetical protein
MSLSPEDGLGFDNSPEDKALDAGDFDPGFGQISITDRLMVLCNRIAKRVNAKYPGELNHRRVAAVEEAIKAIEAATTQPELRSITPLVPKANQGK